MLDFVQATHLNLSHKYLLRGNEGAKTDAIEVFKCQKYLLETQFYYALILFE
jgi:hypothetical protein